MENRYRSVQSTKGVQSLIAEQWIRLDKVRTSPPGTTNKTTYCFL